MYGNALVNVHVCACVMMMMMVYYSFRNKKSPNQYILTNLLDCIVTRRSGIGVPE